MRSMPQLLVLLALAVSAVSAYVQNNSQVFSLQVTQDNPIHVQSPPLQITNLLRSGPSHNRVDLVFFSDGYTSEEHDDFIRDAMRLTQDISGNQTFNTVKPLLNIWAAFSPSNESGIGRGGQPKDTTFGLYRDGTELRAVYYAKPEVAKSACLSLRDQCDYPILLGNDPLYGGLGGEFTVVTSSLANGPLVLRHELGHSIIEVGEEYDGGFAYYGPNSGTNSSHIPWSQWLTTPNQQRVERSVMPMQTYPWTILRKGNPWSIKFMSSGTYSRHLIKFSLSGIPDKTDLRVDLDGLDLQWTPRANIGLDRWHYDIPIDTGLREGEHELKFTLLNDNTDGVAQLCSTEILEFGDESEFVSTPGYYGIFPTFSDKNETTYRPTNAACLMRLVTYPNFCKACLEGLWLSLLRRVNLIDDVNEECVMVSSSPSGPGRWKKTLEIQLVPLAHLRAEPVSTAEAFTITWSRDGYVLEAFTNKTRIEMDDVEALGTYRIHVKFATEEVRKDPHGRLVSGREYTIFEGCETLVGVTNSVAQPFL